MNHTNESPNYNRRRIVAVGLAALAIFGVSKGHDAWDTNQRHVGYVQHPETIPDNERIAFSAGDGDTAFSLGHTLSPENGSSSDLTLEIQNQADENGLLQPGQTIIVERRLLDAQKAEQLTELEQQAVRGAE